MLTANTPTVLKASDWQERARAHHVRSTQHTHPAKARRDRGQPHPIADFLFNYYSFSFGFLEKWHSGINYILEKTPRLPKHLTNQWYAVGEHVALDPTRLPEKQRTRMRHTIELLEATRDRAPNFACHGLHEWAMVYRGQEIRHEKILSLRLPQEEIDTFVESRSICCSHHDAFRFFAKEARPMNKLQPTLESRVQHEQPACIHANMDLYKWAAKAMPWIGSDLLLDCFELAVDLRDLDMRASPYDLLPWGREPVCIETAAGRLQYEQEQKNLAERATPLRQQLIDALQKTLQLTK